MKFGFRTPSLSKSIKSRTTGRAKRALKRAINPVYGKKGMGLINNPKKAMYNKVYNATTVGLWDILSAGNTRNSTQANNNTIEYDPDKLVDLIEQKMKEDGFAEKLEEELKKNGYTLDDFYSEVDSLGIKAKFDGYTVKQRVENLKNSKAKDLTAVDILVLWYIKNKKIPISPETLPRYFNYGYHINFIERLNFLINNNYINNKGEKYLYTEKGAETVEKYKAVVQAHYDNKDYNKDKIEEAFNKIQ